MGSPMRWERGGVILDEYLIEKELGRGGMGQVWLVKSRSTGRRFAVKQALIRDDKHRKAFLTELQTWIDLPEHPNIVPCRFFRTVGEEIVIFADYVDGGSLADWIAKRKLTSVEQILDVAIRFAWGLHAIHERGLIHQDVKPGNVLMTADGVPMITDFGLARARLRAADGSFISPALPQGQQSILVSSGGMTPAYASPEQRAGQPLSRKTDIWSWGVSVLDMFMGGVSCPHGGHIAAEVLAAFVENGVSEDSPAQMPGDLGVVLRRCFAVRQEDRFPDFLQIIDILKGVYERFSGAQYERLRSLVSTPDAFQGGASISEGYIRTPEEWLAIARDAASAPETSTLAPAASEQGSLVRCIAIMTEACALFTLVLADGRTDFATPFADASFVHADLHRRMGDWNGCLAVWRKTVDLLTSAMRADGGVRQTLANALYWQAQALADSGDVQAACHSCGNAMGLLASIPHTHDTLVTLAKVFQLRAKALSAQKCVEKARSDYQVAFDALRALADDVPHDVEIQRAAALCLHNWAGMESGDGKRESAVGLYRRSINIREALLSRCQGDDILRSDLAGTYSNISGLLWESGDCSAALDVVDKAVALRQQLAKSGTKRFAEGLSLAYFNRASLLRGMGRDEEAARDFRDSAELLKRLVHLEGRHDLLPLLGHAEAGLQAAVVELAQTARQHLLRGHMPAAIAAYERVLAIAPDDPDLWMSLGAAHADANDPDRALIALAKAVELRSVQAAFDSPTARYQLANCYLAMANIRRGKGENVEACGLYEKCISVRLECIERDGRRELLPVLANDYLNQCATLSKCGRRGTAQQIGVKAVDILEDLVNRGGRSDLAADLANAYVNAACLRANLREFSRALADLERAVGIYERLA